VHVDGYHFAGADLTQLLLRRFYPERTDRESAIIRDWLLARGVQYDRFAFSVRVGVGQAPNPEHLEGVQRNAVFSTKKRIDVLAWQGDQPFIHEVKERVTPAVLGQLQTYRQLFLEQYPDSKDPQLVALGRTSDDDTLRALQAHGVTVLLYEDAADRE